MDARIAILLLPFLSACFDSTRLQNVSKCGLECYTKTGGTPGVGQCKWGVWVCAGEDDATATCEEQVGPEKETCDLLDNDCDGEVDEHVTRTCKTACGTGGEQCVQGVFTGCSAPQPQPEVCDGRDNDCDGRVDEPEDLPLEFCYDGSPGSIQFGECRPGALRCEEGRKICYGQVLPSAEICNGHDDDCDGQIDENSGSLRSVDIVFVIDNSGSMGGTISAVQTAVSRFVTTYGGRSNIRWGLVSAPSPTKDGVVTLESNLGPASDFSQAMKNMWASAATGMEPTLDAIQDLVAPENPLGMSWAPGSRRVITVFTDEYGQSYRDPVNTYQSVQASIQAAGAYVYVFTKDGTWTAALPPGLGHLRPLTSTASVMESELNAVVQEVSCQ